MLAGSSYVCKYFLSSVFLCVNILCTTLDSTSICLGLDALKTEYFLLSRRNKA